MNLNALHTARKSFIEAESSSRIRRALSHNVRTYADVTYTSGDIVYYRRKNFKGWKGPATVIGQDGQLVAVRHQAEIYRVHPHQLLLKEQCVIKAKGNGSFENTFRPLVKVSNPQRHVVEEESSESEGDHDHTSAINENQSSSSSAHGYLTNSVRPKRNTVVKFRLENDDAWCKAKVLSVQPKQTGTYKNWFNIQKHNEDEASCVNWDRIELWKEVDGEENPVMLTGIEENLQDVVDAKHKELCNLQHHNVYEEVPFRNQATISTRWIITEKLNDGKKNVKARLVARGFEENTDSLQKDSPTCCRESLRLVLMTASTMKWLIHSIDISAAFLQGNSLERELYLKPPADVCSKDVVWHLKRCIYGLNDAPRSWYNRVREVMIKLGAIVSSFDNALFIWRDTSGRLIGVLASHVDDFVFAGTEWFHTHVIAKLMETFKVSKASNGSFKYLGITVKQIDDVVQIDQDLYVPSISCVNFEKSSSDCYLSPDEKSDLKRLSGQMNWVTSQTRPDMSFETCVMSNVGKQANKKILHDANKAVKKLQSDKVQLNFPCLGNPGRLKVVVYSDATYGSLADGSSQGAYLVFIQGENGKVAPISWQSKKLNRVTKSPLASETLALCDGADAAYLVASQLTELFGLLKMPEICCYVDNVSLKETLNTSTIVSDKRLRVDIARLREMVHREEIRVCWIEGKSQIADALTKRGSSNEKLMQVLKSSTLP